MNEDFTEESNFASQLKFDEDRQMEEILLFMEEMDKIEEIEQMTDEILANMGEEPVLL